MTIFIGGTTHSSHSQTLRSFGGNKNLRLYQDILCDYDSKGNPGNLFIQEWKGGLHQHNRDNGSEGALAYIRNNANCYPAYPINVIGYSHGGNIALRAVKSFLMLTKHNEKHIRLITLATPAITEYEDDAIVVGRSDRVTWFNLFASYDFVQSEVAKIELDNELIGDGKSYKHGSIDDQIIVPHWARAWFNPHLYMARGKRVIDNLTALYDENINT